MIRRYTLKVDKTTKALYSELHQLKPPGLRYGEYVEVLFRAVANLYMTGNITLDEILLIGAACGNEVNLQIRIPVGFYKFLNAIFDGAAPFAAIVRFAVRFEPTLRQRYDLEENFRTNGGVGDPTFYSTDFLELWAKYQKADDSHQIRVLRILHSLELRWQAQEDRLRAQEALFEKYGIPGLLKATEYPSRYELSCMDYRELLTVARRWSIDVDMHMRDETLRRIVCTAFGYTPPIPKEPA